MATIYMNSFLIMACCTELLYSIICYERRKSQADRHLITYLEPDSGHSVVESWLK